MGDWTLHFTLDPNVPVTANTSCTVDLVYLGWNASAPFGQGYSDIHHVSLMLYIPAEAEQLKSSSFGVEPERFVRIYA